MDNKSQTISKDAVQHFLESNYTAELATSRQDKPTCSTIVYVVDEELNFYFVTYVDSYKANNLLINPYVSMTIWEPQIMSIQMDGVANIVKDEDVKEWVVNAFGDAVTKDTSFWAPIFRIKGSDYIVFKITPNWLRALDLSLDSVRSDSSPYTEIALNGS